MFRKCKCTMKIVNLLLKLFYRILSLQNVGNDFNKRVKLTMIVLLFPPKAFFNNLVNVESRKGTL